MTRYQLIEVDLAGNSYPVCESSSFAYICKEAALAKQSPDYRKTFCHYIINPDRVDIDCPSGLTEEEQELLP
jgi:hypothetical protein